MTASTGIPHHTTRQRSAPITATGTQTSRRQTPCSSAAPQRQARGEDAGALSWYGGDNGYKDIGDSYHTLSYGTPVGLSASTSALFPSQGDGSWCAALCLLGLAGFPMCD